MLESHKKFHSTNGKRQILVADDELLNRELLGMMLQEDYEILYACDGAETLEMIRAHKDTLSLVLLDILMPVMSGLEVLRAVRTDTELTRIPVIVATAEKASEIESLQLGAIDFIPKPYPEQGVILARVRRTIELYEDRDIIQSTERDVLTGLYNREYFYRYAEQFDQYHKDLEMDAIILDINHFHMVNERYGRAYGDQILRRIGEQVREMVQDTGGIVCRRNADIFMVYCPHREDYREIMDRTSAFLTESASGENRVRLRMGVYACADKEIDIERRFDRAKMAADMVKENVTRNIGIYDDSLHEKELYEEQLIEDFPAAIADGQFKVFYQPKFDVRPDTPVLSSAEALVRWIHPKLGTISPGIFIPLFEKNGLIQKLDTFVWKETARQIREWKDRLQYAIPVSVNVSRIDMYDPNLPDTFQSILAEQELSGSDLLLEVTESAYTEESRQIIETVERLRELGFQIEMDD
ncbi:MAG: EAL domain-containing protein, partial [Eubacterium sp.]|nr:EAL domain-containing protein [Eubacterium sp.]